MLNVFGVTKSKSEKLKTIWPSAEDIANGARICLSSRIWNLWAKALGQKASPTKKDADRIAWIRTFFIVQSIIANIVIIAGVVRHWNG